MPEKEDFSYGVVPLYKDGADWKVLIVHQISYRGSNDTFWILPKGHAEEGETAVDAAKRELKEETGVAWVELLLEPTFTIQYSFIHDGIKINKTVVYYIGFCKSMDTEITQPEEIKELSWMLLSEAEEKVAHQNSKDVLVKVQEHLARNG